MAENVRILHVDDNRRFTRLAAAALEGEDERFELVTEHEVSDALDRLQRERSSIDCILSDHEMPETNGIEFLQTVREQYPDQRLPFILLTGKGNEEVAADALNAGATSYVQKGDSDTFKYVAERIRHDLQAARAEENSARFGTLVRALEDPVYVLDEEGRFVLVNDALVDLVGYGRDEILGSPPSLIKTDAAVETGEHHLGRILSDDGPDSITFEVDLRTADGEVVPCEDHMGVLPYEDETFRGSLGVLRDVSERKARQRALAEARDRPRRILERDLVGLYVARDGELIYHDGRFADLFGHDPEPNCLAGTPLVEVVDPADRSRIEGASRASKPGTRTRSASGAPGRPPTGTRPTSNCSPAASNSTAAGR